MQSSLEIRIIFFFKKHIKEMAVMDVRVRMKCLPITACPRWRGLAAMPEYQEWVARTQPRPPGAASQGW